MDIKFALLPLDTVANPECKDIFVSHASEDKEDVVESLIDCLESKGFSEICYDKDIIEEGHSIIRKINEGLSRSKIGIVIFTPNFVNKPFPEWELECLISLAIYNKIRLIPLKNITWEAIVDTYPLLRPLRFENLDEECDDLVEHISNYLRSATNLIDNPNKEIVIGESMISQDSKLPSKVVTEVDQSTMKNICAMITGSQDQITKEHFISQMRTFAGTKRIWIHKDTWDATKYLMFSNDVSEIRDGLYILGEMLKLSTDSFVLTNAREIFLHKLIDFLDPLNQKRIFYDSLEALEILLGKDHFLKILVSAFIRALENIVIDTEYTNYIQGMVMRIGKYASKDFISNFVKQLEDLIKDEKKEYRTRNRAKNLAEYLQHEFPDFLR